MERGHRASEYRRESSCTICKRRHHTSICKNSSENQPTTSSTNDRLLNIKSNDSKAVVHPVVIVGYKCRALIDTGAGSSYVSSTLLDILKQQPIKREIRSFEMFGTTTKYVGIYEIKMTDVKEEFQIQTEVIRVAKKELLMLDNQKYAKLISEYTHLSGINMNDDDDKGKLHVHLTWMPGNSNQGEMPQQLQSVRYKIKKKSWRVKKEK